MTDVHTPEIRSYNMSRIRSKNTKPEELVCKYLFALGYRYRKNDKRYPGKPDIVLPKYKTVIFVNGCFWHMHDCPGFVMPKSNYNYWEEKLNRNGLRDQQHYQALAQLGWKVCIVWECQLKKQNIDDTMQRLVAAINGKSYEFDA